MRPDPDLEPGESQSFNQLRDWGEAIDTSLFYGRTKELAQLRQWVLTDRCRLIALLGMGGIGKTALSVKLAEQLQDKFEFVIWRSLRNAPPLTDLLSELIGLLSGNQETELPQDTGARVSLLLSYLRSCRCLLVLDNAKVLLCSGGRAGQYREGYEDYGRELMRRVGEEPHQSCLVLTSREKPREVGLLQGEATPVRSLHLSGLREAEGQKLLRAKGLFQSLIGIHTQQPPPPLKTAIALSDGEEVTRELVRHYRGNPLALKLVATTIQDVFGGDIAEFLRQGVAVFGDIQDVLEQQFARLSELEQAVMYWLAIERESVSFAQLRADLLPEVASSKLLEAVESLRRRSLMEESGSCFTLQPVVMEYVTERFLNSPPVEMRGILRRCCYVV